MQNQLRLLRFNSGDRQPETFGANPHYYPDSFKRGFSHQLKHINTNTNTVEMGNENYFGLP